MARTFTQLKSSIWSDRSFVALPAHAQRVYLLAKSQANVSWCGVVPFTEKRWASMAPDTTVGVICDAINVLVDRGYVVLDPETEELWVRSWVKHNGVMEQPNLRKAMRAAYETILSTGIKRAVYDSLPDEEKALVTTPPEDFPSPSETPPEPFRRPECVGQDLDLDLHLHKHRESGVDPKPSGHVLLAPGRPSSLSSELDQIVMVLVDLHGPDRVDAAVQRLVDEGRRFAWPKDARKALEAILGPVVEAKPHPLDEAQRAQRMAMVDLASERPDWLGDDGLTPEERRAANEARRAGRGAA